RRLFTLYCDELQNLVAYDAGIDVLLSEARKFAVSIVSANQYLEQYTPSMRAALLAMGSHIFFQLSGPDASRIAYANGRGPRMADRLRTMPQRHFIARLRGQPQTEGVVPSTTRPSTIPISLLRRIRNRHSRAREDIERSIVARHHSARGRKDGLGYDF